ncbi:hypothetical protein BOTBODRAFT_36207 [Botryobasidium botryosum FD-172 SS1]|uniref:Mug135-like C-terminal domain-containing protein n=1 Tax=Botryobasidium botryosum (strain FD-172 SS1) TaxID=930990 RepID=A0A067M4N3_BOTB1|nr:hypothetical protein BOTBODRAFT_36207 [Botryobasidium botryosum FD-172 SS1]
MGRKRPSSAGGKVSSAVRHARNRAKNTTTKEAPASIEYQYSPQGKAALNAAPAWFLPAMRIALQPMERRLDAIERRLGAIERSLDRLLRTCALSYNQRAGDGSHTPFEMVAFCDGSDPTAAPYNLPLLSSWAAVDNLSSSRCTIYFQGYFPNQPVPRLIATRRKKILIAIGYLHT